MKLANYSEKSLFFRLFRLSRNLEEKLTRNLSSYDLNMTEALCLVFIFIEEKKEIYLKDISETLGFKKALVSHTITRLETKKLISRKMNESDRRRYRFSLSKYGKEIIPKLFKIFDDIDDHIESRLSQKSQAKLETILSNLLPE